MDFTDIPKKRSFKGSNRGYSKSAIPKTDNKRPRYETPIQQPSYESVQTIVMQEDHTRYTDTYNISCCSEIVKRQSKFTQPDDGDEECTQLVNCLDSGIISVPTSRLSLRALAEFENVGHTLAVPMSHNYSFKVCFDLDLIDPGNGTASTLPDTQVEMLYREVCSVLTRNFKTIREFSTDGWWKSNSFVMTHNKNVHIYMNLDVSIVVYDHMVDVLNCELSPVFTSVYKVDKISQLPLPYSAKVDGDEYKLRLPKLSEVGHINFGRALQFYDYSWYEQSSVIKPNQRPVLNYEVRPMASTATLKAACKNQVFLSLSDLSRNVIRKTSEVPDIIHLISRMKLASIKSVQSTYQLLDYVVNLRNEARLNKNIALYQNPDAKYDSVQHSMSPLNAYIAESIYLSPPTEESRDNIGYFIAALVDYEEFSTYLLIVAMLYCTSELVYTDERESTKRLALEYIKSHLESATMSNIVNAIDEMMKYNIMDELIHSFGASYHDLLDYIILETSLGGKYNKANTQDYINAVMSHVFSLGARGSNIQAFETVIKLVCFPLKLEFGEECLLYNYKNQSYEPVKQLKLSNQVRIIQSLLATDDDTIGKDKDLACAQINANLVLREVRFNEYKHFINTKYGVFYTITGTYLPKTPFLYFNMEKAVCSYTAGMSKELNIMNSQLVNSYNDQHRLLETYFKKQSALFYLTRMIPGLMKVECCIYTHKTAERAWLSIWNFFDCDRTNDGVFYMCQPLMWKLRKHTMCVAKMNSLLYDRYPNAMSYDELRASYESTEFSKDLTVSDSPFIVANACVLTLLMGKIISEPVSMPDDDELGARHEEIHGLFERETSTSLGEALVKQYSTLEEADVHFRCKGDLWEKAWVFVFNDFKPEYRQFKGLFTFLSESVKFDEAVLRDYFSHTSAVYQPCRVQKHMNVYDGSPRCGKTTLLNMLAEMTGDGGVFRTSKDYKEPKASSGPSPNAIHLKTKYMSIINEISGISQNLLKTMTGDDGTNDNRTLFSTRFPMLSSCTFLVAACNHLPKMHMPDEAIRDRLVFFHFEMRAVDILKEPNCIFAYAENCTYKESLNVVKMAPLLSNLLYVHHRFNKNEFGIISPKTMNEMSLKLLDSFMARNNYLYKLLEMCGVKLSPSLTIGFEELRDAISMRLGDYNADYCTAYSISRVMTEFRANFKQFYDDNLSVYVGLGIPDTSNATDSYSMVMSKSSLEQLFDITPNPEGRVNLRMLKYEVSKYCNLDRLNALDGVLEEFKKRYTFDKDKNELLGVDIKVLCG